MRNGPAILPPVTSVHFGRFIKALNYSGEAYKSLEITG
jgi:hypothetical protein